MINQTNQMKTKHADKIAALQLNIKALEADGRGEQVQFRGVTEHSLYKDWTDVTGAPCWEFHLNDYRPKPQRKFVPWTFETCPVGAVVKIRNSEFKGLIKYCDSDNVSVGVEDRLSYQWLFVRYEQLNGQPCGTEVEE